MADWYVSSVNHAAVAAFQTAHAYISGDLIRAITPTQNNRHVFRCTTPGTTAGSEPTWSMNNNATTVSNTATFTCVTGQSTYFWAAAAGDRGTLDNSGTGTNRLTAGDRIFYGSDHAQSTTAITLKNPSSYTPILNISVSRAGSTPPVAADITAGASIATSAGAVTIETPQYFEGFTVTPTTTIVMGSANNFDLYFKNSALQPGSASNGIQASNGSVRLFLDNTTIKFAAVGSGINPSASFELVWLNTPSAISGAGSAPTTLFNNSSAQNIVVTCRGVDFSAMVTGKRFTNPGTPNSKLLFDSCKIDSAVTRSAATVSTVNASSSFELLNCYDGTNIISERYTAAGAVTTERTITLSGGANDGAALAHKIVASANVDKYVAPMEGFVLDVQNALTGSHTATVEIISSTTLLDDEVWLDLEYYPTSGSSLAAFAYSRAVTVLTTGANVTSSSVTWNSSPATPIKQKLVATFNAQQGGRLRGTVKFGKASTTMYYDPKMTVV